MSDLTPLADAELETAAEAFEKVLNPPPPEVLEEMRKAGPARARAHAQATQAAPRDQELDLDEEGPESPPDEDEVELEDEDEEQDKQPQDPMEVLHTVKVAGEEVQVPLRELLNGYSRTADYQRKTQSLAAERRSLEEASKGLMSEREQYASNLQYLQESMQALLPKEPDWDALYRQDPLEYVRQREVQREAKERLTQIQAENSRVQYLLAQQRQQELAQTLAQEKDLLLDVIPEWRDGERMKTEQAALREFGKTLGFSEDELRQVVDHRAVKLLRDAYLYRQAVSRARERRSRDVEQGPRPVLPGSPRATPSKVTQLTRAKQRLAKTGNPSDAVSVFERLL